MTNLYYLVDILDESVRVLKITPNKRQLGLYFATVKNKNLCIFTDKAFFRFVAYNNVSVDWSEVME